MGALRVSVDAALHDWQRCDVVGSPFRLSGNIVDDHSLDEMRSADPAADGGKRGSTGAAPIILRAA